MNYLHTRWVPFCFLLLAPTGTAFAQAPTISTIVPMANARAASRTAPLTVSFSQPLTAASAGALKVFSNQRGGLRSRGTTPAVVNGNRLSFAPTPYDFRPGETVQYTVTTMAASSTGALAPARVGQFTTAVGGTGTGTFVAGFRATNASSNTVYSMALADVDGDGDLDLVSANFGNYTVDVRLNNGAGAFGNPQRTSVGFNPGCLTVGDIDGDGDLDVLAGNFFFNQVSVLLNNGAGSFTSSQPALAGGADVKSLVLGDVDGDGDLDLLTVSATGSASVQLNNGNGAFGSPSSVRAGFQPADVVVGDVDGDGDLDLLVANYNSSGPGTVSIRLNNGAGSFGGTLDLPVGNGPGQVEVSDVDGDGDLDMLAANSYSGTVSVRLNDGTGTFSGNQNVGGLDAFSLAMGDIDADGDIDLLSGLGGNLGIRLNDGSGLFGGTQDISLAGGIGNGNLLLADLDGDGDLDFATANAASNATINVYLNGGTGLLPASASRPVAGLALYPNPAHGPTTITGAAPNATLTLLDGLGRALLTATSDANGTASLALPSGLPAGVYLVRSGGQVRRLAVQ